MSDFLDLNGITIAVQDGQGTAPAPTDIGTTERAVDGTLIRGRIALKQNYTFATPPTDPVTAVALKALINGFGNHWSFDSNTYSGKGVGPLAPPSALYQAGVTAGKYGNCLQVGTTPYGTADVWEIQPTGLDALGAFQGNHTWMAWIRAQDGSTWNHYLVTDTLNTKAYYKNGVLAAADSDTNCVTDNAAFFVLNGYGYIQNGSVALPGWLATHSYAANAYVQPSVAHANGRFYKVTAGGGGNSGSTEPTWPTVLGNTVTDGALTWTDQGPSSLFVDDLVILPFPVPSAWVSQLYTFCSAQAYPDPPQLLATGLAPLPVSGNSSILVMGTVETTTFVQVMSGGTMQPNYQTIQFQLTDV